MKPFLWLFMVVAIAGLAACMELQRRAQYDNLDQVAVDATGKQLWEIEFGDQEIAQVRIKLHGTTTASLYCIRDNANRHFGRSQALSIKQSKLRADNIKLLVKRALIPVIEMRESEGKRRIMLESCNTR